MKKVCAVLFVLLLAVASFAQVHDANVVRWKTIVGNITVSNNDAVAGINPGTTPWSTTGGRASVNLVTGHVSFDVDGLVLNGGNATGTPDGIDSSRGLADLRCGRAGSNHFHHDTSAAKRARECGFLRDIQYHSGHLHKPPLSDPNWPRSSRRQPALDRYGSRALLWRLSLTP
jgi:hypothetical protein